MQTEIKQFADEKLIKDWCALITMYILSASNTIVKCAFVLAKYALEAAKL